MRLGIGGIEKDIDKVVVVWYNGRMETEHSEHLDNQEWHEDCQDCKTDLVAIDWLLAVRKYGIETANRMFPS